MATGIFVYIESETGELLVVWKKATSPSAEVGRSVPLAFPYDGVYSLPEELPKGAYIIEFWKTLDGATLNEFIRSWTIQVSGKARYSITRLEYFVGRGRTNEPGQPVWNDPEVDSNTIEDERLIGFNNDSAFVQNKDTGDYPKEFVNWTPTGIEITNGALFAEDEMIVVTLLNKEESDGESGESTTGLIYTGIKELKNDVNNTVDFNSTCHNKKCYANFTGAVGKVVFPDFSLIPDMISSFSTHMGSQRYLVLQFATGNTLHFNGISRNRICLAKGEKIEITKVGGLFFVSDYNGNAKVRGTVFPTWYPKTNTEGLQQVDDDLAEQNAAEYPGIWDELLQMPASSKTTLSSWPSNKQKWGFDLANEKFRFPSVRNMHVRFRNGDAGGDYLADEVGPHAHKIKTGRGGGIDSNVNGGAVLHTNQNTINWPENSGNFTIIENTSTETSVKAFKQYASIFL